MNLIVVILLGLAIFVIYSLVQSQKRIENKLKELQYACSACNSGSTSSTNVSNSSGTLPGYVSTSDKTSNNLLNNLKKALINSI